MTSYTDEQVLSAIEALGSYETMCGFAHILASVHNDRARLQAEVGALRLCAIKYLTWHHVVNPVEGLDRDLRDPDMCGDAALKSESIDSARAKKGDA
ncbi:hypothetical protein FHW84_001778 [Dyella sp. SG562]|uniref:hypothetical protein n=1 Tax=Dyella sp. SG562 TaxID=2587017 RepID=UPI001424900E|nr:hypothetical protein [Dyella sp. SG562]NII73209.1 hypothetical protein [Dyella sp. SG562]